MKSGYHQKAPTFEWRSSTASADCEVCSRKTRNRVGLLVELPEIQAFYCPHDLYTSVLGSSSVRTGTMSVCESHVHKDIVKAWIKYIKVSLPYTYTITSNELLTYLSCDNCNGTGMVTCKHGLNEEHQYCSHNKTYEHDS